MHILEAAPNVLIHFTKASFCKAACFGTTEETFKKKKSVGVLIHILTLLKISSGSNYVYVPVKTDTQFCASHSKSSNEDHPD